jgi:hypothetical protein
LKPDQRVEEKRRLGEALDGLNAARAAMFSLQAFYAPLAGAAKGRFDAVKEMSQALIEMKARLVDLSEAAARMQGPEAGLPGTNPNG